MPQREDRQVSCNVLLSLINSSTNIHKKNMYISDFATKNNGSPASVKNKNSVELLKILVDPDYKSIVRNISTQKKSGLGEKLNEMTINEMAITNHKKLIDVAIVTIKQPELIAAKIALGIDPNQQKGENQYHGYQYWLKSLEREDSQGGNLSILLTMVGQGRNVNCANACRTLFEQYNIKTCVLVGMAAGPKSKVKLGDVVVAETVIDYEGERVEAGGRQKRPVPFKINRIISRQLDYFDPKHCGWYDTFYANLDVLEKFDEIPNILKSFKPKFHKDVIISGEKLIVDDSLEKRRKDIHEGTRALEMEASGFAATCEECGKIWLVFRGVSDYGDHKTKDEKTTESQNRKIWQSSATLAAVSSLICFLQNFYNYPDDEKIF